MTPKDILQVHADIERQNKRNVKRWKVEKLHVDLVRRGQFAEARMILRLLRNGYIKMYLDDVSWNVQCALEKIGHPVWYAPNGNTASASIERGRVA